MAHPVEIELFPSGRDEPRDSAFRAGSSIGRFDRKAWEAIYSIRDVRRGSRSFREKVYDFLDRPEGGRALTYHFLVFVLVLACYVLGVLSTVPEYSGPAEDALHYLERTVVSVFGAEYLLRLWAAGCRSKYRGVAGRLRYCARALSLIDLMIVVLSVVFFTVPFDGQIVATSAVRGFRFVQILRMLHVDRQGGTWQLLKSVVYSHRQELTTTAYVATLGLTLSSYSLYLVEKDVHPDRAFQTYADSLWWSLITMTTIGYGDKVPSTTAGKLLAAGCALFTVSFFALPAGILGSGFALKVQQQQKRKRFSRRIPAAATLIQCAWRCHATGDRFPSEACWRLPGARPPFSSGPGPARESEDRAENFSSQESSRQTRPNGPRPPSWGEGSWPAGAGFYGRRRGLARDRSAPELRSDRRETDPGFDSSDDSPLTADRQRSVDSSFFESVFGEESESGPCGRWTRARGSLTEAQRNAVRAVAKMKYYVALKKFQEARRPFDVSDVIEQYSQGYIDMTARMKEIQRRLDNTLGRPVFYARGYGREPVTVVKQLRVLGEQVAALEKRMEEMNRKLDRLPAGAGQRPPQISPGY